MRIPSNGYLLLHADERMPAAILILLPLLLLLISPFLIIIFRIWRPRFAYYWLIGTFAALFAWLGILILQPSLPASLPMGVWRPVEIFPISPQLSIDAPSWLFALAAVTILLAVNLTGIASASSENETSPSWMSLAGGAGITGLSLLVMFSANILTILLAWVFLDIVEFMIYLSLAKDRQESERVVIKFSTRSAGMLIGVYAGINASIQGMPLTLNELTPLTSGTLILAASIRMGLIPNTPILPFRNPPQAGYGALLRIVTTAAHFPLLVKTAQSGASPQFQNFLWLWTGLTALLSAISWISSRDGQSGRHYWIIALSSLVVASSMSGHPQAVIAFGWALMLPGSLILLSGFRNKVLTVLFFLGALAISTLPFTPSWNGVMLYSGGFHAGWLLLIPAQSLILAGYLLQSFKKGSHKPAAERWANWIHHWGMFIILLTTLLLSWWNLSGTLGFPEQSPTLMATWPALVILLLTGFAWLIGRRVPTAVAPIFSRLSANLSFGKILKPVWSFFFLVRRIFLFTSRTLESQSGILWALLILVLLISLFSQVS